MKGRRTGIPQQRLPQGEYKLLVGQVMTVLSSRQEIAIFTEDGFPVQPYRKCVVAQHVSDAPEPIFGVILDLDGGETSSAHFCGVCRSVRSSSVA